MAWGNEDINTTDYIELWSDTVDPWQLSTPWLYENYQDNWTNES